MQVLMHFCERFLPQGKKISLSVSKNAGINAFLRTVFAARQKDFPISERKCRV